MTDNDVRALMTTDDQLHDVKRARLWARIEARLPAEGARPSVRARSRLAWVTGGTLIAAAAAIALSLGHTGESPRALVAPADATLTSMVGPYTRVAVIGPARVEVGAQGEQTTVRVRSGTMLAVFEGGAGRSLRVEAPGTVVEVVGTLFAVAVDGPTTCVSVAHGQVRVTRGAGVVMVGGGERSCSGDPQPGLIEPGVRDALIRHEQLIAAAPPARAQPSVQPIDPPAPPAPPSKAPPVAAAATVATVATARVASRDVLAPAPTPSLRSSTPPTPLPATIAHVSVTELSPEPTTPSEALPPQPSSPPPVPPPAAPPPASPPPPVTADTLYAAAETALAKGDLAAADRALARIVEKFSSSSLLDQALYERARLAYQRHAWSQARRDLDQLATVRNSALAEPGQYLACRVALAAKDAGVARCFTSYRAAYPHSPHALDVLALLVELAYADGGCRAAAPLISELVRDHREAASAHTWRARCPEAR